MDSNTKLVPQHSAYIDRTVIIEAKQDDLRKVMKSRGGTRRKNINRNDDIMKPEIPKFANLQMLKIQKAPR